MIRYVMFGHNHLFGDFVDLIHLNGGVLSRVIQNVPEIPVPGRKNLRERLELVPYPVEVESIDGFKPDKSEQCLIGFTGFKMAQLRERLSEQFGAKFPPLVHPSAIISPTVTVSNGCIINSGVIIASNVEFGLHVFLNRGSTVGHDTRLGNYSIVQPGADLAGHVTVGTGAVIGLGARVLEDRSIGDHSVVASGAVVTKDVAEYSMVAGVPAEFKKAVRP